MVPYVILGKGGHAQALRDYVPKGSEIVFIDKGEKVPPFGWVLVGVGDLETRKLLYNAFHFRIPDEGRQIMRGAIVYSTAKLGKNVLVNTGAQIDHDCVIGDHCIISPGAVLCGNVTLGDCCQIGAGTIIVQGVTLDPGTKIPAGTLCVGQDDLRRPVRVVSDRELSAGLRPLYGEATTTETEDYCLYSYI